MPLLGHGDGLLLQLALVDVVALMVSVVDDGRDLTLADGVHDREKVLLVALSALVELGRHVWLDRRPFGVVRIQCLNGYFRIVAHVHWLDFGLLEQPFLTVQDQADPFLRQAAERWSVQLKKRKGQVI